MHDRKGWQYAQPRTRLSISFSSQRMKHSPPALAVSQVHGRARGDKGVDGGDVAAPGLCEDLSVLFEAPRGLRWKERGHKAGARLLSTPPLPLPGTHSPQCAGEPHPPRPVCVRRVRV